MAARGYGSNYRGREPVWKKFAAVFLILVILAALAAIYFQSHLVYDDNGVARLELPWSQEEAPPEAPAPAVGSPPDEPLNITVEDSDKSPKAALKCVQLAAMPLTAEAWEEARAALSAAGSPDAVALTVKDAKGYVYYDSLTAKAVNQKKIVRSDGTTAEAIADLNGAYPYTIARISCLLDPIASREKLDDMGLKNTGRYIFYDLYSGTWLDPSKEAAVEYIVHIAGECAALGFDEILLTDLSYPTAGKLDKIDYGAAGETEDGRSQALCGIVSAVKAALAEEYPYAKVSVELPLEVIVNGSDEVSGQVLTDMAKVAHRIYTPATAVEAPTLAKAVEQAGSNGLPYFVPELSADADAGDLESWLRLAE